MPRRILLSVLLLPSLAGCLAFEGAMYLDSVSGVAFYDSEFDPEESREALDAMGWRVKTTHADRVTAHRGDASILVETAARRANFDSDAIPQHAWLLEIEFLENRKTENASALGERVWAERDHEFRDHLAEFEARMGSTHVHTTWLKRIRVEN